MKIERNRVVELHYDLRSDDGPVIESTREREPIAALIGHRNVVFGLERALEGHETGDRFEVTVSPEDGYGPRREGWTARFSKKHFPHPKRLEPGMRSVVRTAQGLRLVTVVKVGGKVVDVDLNHPLAGHRLRYDVEVVSVREAQPEELAHGHVHRGGHHH
jgi:FKBP-type peptidyl-prolyl cis-trans isomerase SlyD